MKYNYEKIIKNVCKAIKDCPLCDTQKQFSFRSGISEEQVCRILKGQRGITLKNFIKICYATGKTPNELLGWRND